MSIDAGAFRFMAAQPLRAVLLTAALGLVWGCSDPVHPPEEDPPALIVFTMNPAGVSQSEGRDVFVIRADGTDETRLTTGAGAFGASWSPDGSRITFGSHPGFGGDGQIYVMNADGSGLEAITSASATYSSPAWSPDGSRILAVRTGTPSVLTVVDADGSSETPLVECPYSCAWPAWSPDGSTIVVVVWAPIASPANFSPVLYLVGPADPEFVRLPGGFEYGHMPAWTPDSSLLFSGQRDGEHHAFYLTTTGGQVLERFDPDGSSRSSPSLSPDGGQLLYFDHGTPSRIMLLDLSTGTETIVREWAESRSNFPTPRLRP